LSTTGAKMTTTIDSKEIDIPKIRRSADYVRYLSLECIQRANSGHPGLPLGCADLGVMLYRYFLKSYPGQTEWRNRDRFILSAGHGSMLLYSLLYSRGHFEGSDLANFRQLGSKTPGHPEYELEVGIETTTGPLGQGIANAVGCAIEGKMLAQEFNSGNEDDAVDNLFDYNVYALMGDGCMMEGISYEASSMAGHLGLDNLIAIYDSNSISIDGSTDITFTENVEKRFLSQNWDVEKANNTDLQDVYDKLQSLKSKKGKPKLLIVTTNIGEGLDQKKGKSDIHGAPAGIPEIVYFVQNSTIRPLFEEKYGKDAVANSTQLAEIIEKRIQEKNSVPLLHDPEFFDFMQEGNTALAEAYNRWNDTLSRYRQSHPKKIAALDNYFKFNMPEALTKALLEYKEEKQDATRGISGRLLNLCASHLPQMVGGVADLAGSTKAFIKNPGEKKISYISRQDFSHRNIAFGVREHAMGAIGNGLALNKTMIPFTSTFFTFFDYMKPAVRLAALMKLKHLFIFSHDSIHVGEDGPTHQPIEHLNAIRLIPGLYTFRPANDVETAFSYLDFLENTEGPAALITSRQKMSESAYKNITDREAFYNDFKKGGYIFYETDETQKPDIILTASGSEVSLAMETTFKLEEQDKKNVRVISIPCLERLNEADENYKEMLFTPDTPLVIVETASHRGVNLFYGPKVLLVDIQTFGISAPGNVAAKHFGFTSENIYQLIKEKQL
jgi:transketolase